MKKRIVCALLCGALCLSPAFGAGVEEKFPAVNQYPGFADVAAGSWYESAVRTCYEVGLMQGTNLGFEPGKALTVAECATIAARLREKLTGEAIPAPDPGAALPGQKLPWWHQYLDYLRTAQPTLTPLLAHPEEPISRAQYLRLLSAAIEGQGLLEPINSVASLPDTGDAEVLAFYNAGILNGMDKYGTFAGERTLTRAECAAMAARIADPGLRLTVRPADYSMFTAAHLTPDALLFPTVTAETYLTEVNSLIAHLEKVCAGNDMEFNWLNTYGDQTFANYVKSTALTELGVNLADATPAYEAFDVQVYYTRLVDLTGGL